MIKRRAASRPRGGSRFQQTISGLFPNTTYNGHAWVRANNATAGIGVGNYGGGAITVGTTQPTWTLLTFTFTTDGSHTTADI